MQSNSELTTEHLTGLASGPQTGLIPMNQARQAAEDGMTRALNAAERQTLEWADIALAFLKQYAAREPRFTAFMVVAKAGMEPGFPAPPSDKAWGGIFQKAAKVGVIRKTGQYLPHPQRHACPAIVWESLVFAA